MLMHRPWSHISHDSLETPRSAFRFEQISHAPCPVLRAPPPTGRGRGEGEKGKKGPPPRPDAHH